ncbi:DUF1963 domain-containing protein [Aquabacter sp. CN5-332]|uniref:DUF1963 domain-containing protein n=1 Tax=Aquabacter sp. CN5-332 TaxID=3156608 RepID=UPI0032B5D368
MSLMQPEHDALIAKIATLTEAMGDRDRYMDRIPVSRYTRFFKQRHALLDRIRSDPARRELLQALLDRSEPEVRLLTASYCCQHEMMVAEAERAVEKLARGRDYSAEQAAAWLESHAKAAVKERLAEPKLQPPKKIPYAPMPGGCTHETGAALINAAFSEPRAGTLAALLKRAVRLWPVKFSGDPVASRFGGLPVFPKGQSWPRVDDEPMVFVGQINCAELRAAVGKTPFPDRGILQFFGESDGVMGCGPCCDSAVLYFPDPQKLGSAPLPVEDFELSRECGLAFYDTVELPDPQSDAVEALGLTAAEVEAYAGLRAQISNHGMPEDPWSDARSKLLGWPDLIQERDVGVFLPKEEKAGEKLLLQANSYHDGSDWQSWGDGGNIYFVLEAEALAQRDFDDVCIDMQGH